MKAILNLRKSIVYVAAFAAMFSLASCDDDDDDTPKVMTLASVEGTYEGGMAVNPITAAQATDEKVFPYEVKFQVESGKIATDSIPLKEFLLAIGETPQLADELVKEIGKIPFEASYKGDLNAAKDSIYMTVTASPISFEYEVADEGGKTATNKVEIAITAADNKANSYSDKKILKLNLIVDEIKVNEEAVEDYNKQNIVIELNQK